MSDSPIVISPRDFNFLYWKLVGAKHLTSVKEMRQQLSEIQELMEIIASVPEVPREGT